jgi:mono/diheme cytochrome c family protein
MRKYLIIAVGLVLVALLAPGRRTNPPVTHTVNWDDPATEQMFRRACADCHSNETAWPWYSRVAPASWFMIHHVNEAREHLNISSGILEDADEAAEEVEEGKMPLTSYQWLHAAARLTPEERAALAKGLENTFGRKEHRRHPSADHADDD